MPNTKNLLGAEKSPYLLQHQNNPVWWHPWGAGAFERAAREDKPVFLSIGYSTCYWCHVMEHDSFEQQAVADVLNEHFVSIKVDREEHPDVDQIYMDVVVGIHGHGGWPMSVFLTPERKPFWGGTFFYRDAFIQILKGIAQTWRAERAKIESSTGELMRYLESKQERPGGGAVTKAVFMHALEQLLLRFDRTYGGFGPAPKFPPTQQLLLLMRAHAMQGDAASLEAINTTLSGMARGGLFDQVGGGFHRYSVDGQWLIPHFEKMLYDNALLAQAYLEAVQLTGSELYRMVARRTLDYMLEEMRDRGGAFQSAEDAGEVEREGEFYAWTPAQVRNVLGDEEGARICALFGVSDEGNFERGTSVMHIAGESRWREVLEPRCVASLTALQAARRSRTAPHRDTKVLAGWNGLAISACARGYQVLGDARYLDAAVAAASFVCSELWPESGLQRRYCDGSAGIAAVHEDYAYLIEGLLALFVATGDGVWLSRAIKLQDEQDRRLFSGEHRAYLSSASEGLIVQVCEWGDGATPSPNGISLLNLTLLAELSGEARFAQRALELESGIPGEATSHPVHYCSALRGVMLRRAPASVVVAVSPPGAGKPSPEVLTLWGRYLPFTAVVPGQDGAGSSGEVPVIFRGRVARGEKTAFYVCRGTSCLEPTVDVQGVEDVCSLRNVSDDVRL